MTSRDFAYAAAAASFLLSSTAASAASPRFYGPDPLAVLSVMSGGAPAAVLCGTSVAASAAQVTRTGCVIDAQRTRCVLPQTDPQAKRTGCVLPQIDAPPAENIITRLSVSPLLAGLFALAGGVTLYLLLHNGDHNNGPISPA